MKLEELQVRESCSPLPPGASVRLQSHVTGPMRGAWESGAFLHLVPGGRRLAELQEVEGALHGPAGRPRAPGLVTPQPKPPWPVPRGLA